MKTLQQNIGQRGEDFAEEYLRNQKKHKILIRNWRQGHGEIDLISQDGEITVFVEVRTRALKSLVGGYFSISAHKKSVLRKTAMQYIDQKNVLFYRFDVVEVLHDDGEMQIFHYENVPLFT